MLTAFPLKYFVKGTVMQIEKPLNSNRLSVLRCSTFRISTIHNLQKFTHEICFFLKKVAYFLTVSIVFSVYKQNFTAQ